eukprot:jgi/Undpi1/11722/HiC_scaffold_37.g14017.m1
MASIRHLVPFLLFSAALAAQGVRWEPFLKTALQKAETEKRVLFIAVVMPGERGSDAVVPHYKDSRITSLSKNTVNVYLEVGAGGRPSGDEREILQNYLGAEPLQPIAVPHHVVVHPDGKTVLSSAAYQVTAGQLEWFLADGIQKYDEGFEWDLDGRARAPEGLLYGETAKAEDGDKPTPKPSKKEVAEAIGELKKSRFSRRAMNHYRTLLRSDEPSAIKFVETQLRNDRGWLKNIALRLIGEMSPTEWSKILVAELGEREAATRESAARGLYSLSHDKTNKAIRKQLRVEKEDDVRAWLVRAAAKTGPKDKGVISSIRKILDKDDSESVRAHTAVAAGVIEDQKAAYELLETALDDPAADVRAAAAYSMAMRRDKELLPSLDAALKAEKDDDTKHWIELAIDIIKSKRDMREFKAFAKEVLGEDVRRGRGDGGFGGGRGGGGGGRGAGGGGRGTGGGG